MLKLPQAYMSGLEFLYYDSESRSEFQTESNLGDQSSPLMRTLSLISDQTTEQTASIFWNDQPPNQSRPSPSFAHAKGFMGFDLQGNGFTVIHSAPNFVSVIDRRVVLEYPTEQTKFGQHFFCITMSGLSTFDEYGEALQVDRPYTYNSSIPKSIESSVPNLVKLIGKSAKSPDSSQIYNFKSRAGHAFTKFAKSGTWNVSFYATLVAPYYHNSMIFETWGDGAPGLMLPECGTYQVLSNLNTQFSPSIGYSYTYDHSKYGITEGTARTIVCFGDINRQYPQ